MLIVKIMSPGGGEEIHCGLSVGFNPKQQSIAVSGMDQKILLKEGETAHVMTANGKTISHYVHSISPMSSIKTKHSGICPETTIWVAPSELGRPM